MQAEINFHSKNRFSRFDNIAMPSPPTNPVSGTGTGGGSSEGSKGAEMLRKSTTAYRVIKQFVMKVKAALKEPPLTVFGLTRKKIPKIAEVVEQSKLLCEDYIYNRLDSTLSHSGGKGQGEEDGHGLLSGGGSVAIPPLTDVSREIQLIGRRLETSYPLLYQNISRQINMPFKSDIAARKALNIIGDVMFKNGVVTWARLVALFAVTGSIASEFVHHDKPETIRCLISVFADVIERLAAPWICQQGGWVEVTKAFRFNNETRSLWVLTSLGAILGFAFTWLTASQI